MNSTLMSRTAIIGVRNIYDYPDTLLDFFIIIIISCVPYDILFEVNKIICHEILCCVNFFAFGKSGPQIKINKRG